MEPKHSSLSLFLNQLAFVAATCGCAQPAGSGSHIVGSSSQTSTCNLTIYTSVSPSFHSVLQTTCTSSSIACYNQHHSTAQGLLPYPPPCRCTEHLELHITSSTKTEETQGTSRIHSTMVPRSSNTSATDGSRGRKNHFQHGDFHQTSHSSTYPPSCCTRLWATATHLLSCELSCKHALLFARLQNHSSGTIRSGSPNRARGARPSVLSLLLRSDSSSSKTFRLHQRQ